MARARRNQEGRAGEGPAPGMASASKREKTGRAIKRLLAGAGAVSLLTGHAQAAPQNAQVVAGSATVAQQGGVTTIRAGNNAILQYSQFNVAPHETVRFVQPSAQSRVLNRVTGNAPSTIAGSLQSNGIVYLVNPRGVYFLQGSVVNVGGLYAAAGKLSNADFLAGNNAFRALSGKVVNEGAIEGRAIHLAGNAVANHDSIVSEAGIVTLVAGGEVYLREQGGRITVKVDGREITDQPRPASGGAKPSLGGEPAVENTGSVSARRGTISLGAGDMYSLAVRNAGSVKADGGKVTVAATGGAVSNSGQISAGSMAQARGEVVVQAPAVVNSGEISADAASGAAAAGRVEVTSDAHTYLLGGSRVSAAGRGASAAGGGDVLVHSYHGTTTVMRGATIDASGGASAAGGRVEVSGRALALAGFIDLRGGNGAPAGQLLIDPLDLVISDTGASDALLADRRIDFTEPDAISTAAVSDEALEAITGSITLQATRDLTVNQQVDLTNNNDVTLEAGRHLTFNAAINGTRNLTARADSDGNADGDLTVNAALTGIGRAAAFQGNRIFLNGATITTGRTQQFVGDVTLGVDTTLNATGTRFEHRLNSDAAPRALTTNANTYFGGAVGDAAPLASLLVQGAANFYGGAVTTLGTQTYREATTGVDTVLTGTTIHFRDVVNGDLGAEGLRVVGNAIFDGTVGETRLLKGVFVTGTTRLNGGLVHTVDDQDNAGAVTLGRDNTLISNSGDIRFASSINGPFHLGAFARLGNIRLGDTVGGAAKLASLELAAGPLITIDAPLVRAVGDIVMNRDGKGAVPTIATIAAPSGDLVIHSDAGDFLVGPNEKITNIGALSIDSPGAGSTATVGDLNSLGDMRITASNILLRLRGAGAILNSVGAMEADAGVDIVTGGRLFFSVAPATLGSGAAPRIGSPDGPAGDVPGTLGGFGVTRIAPLTVDRFTYSGTVLDLRVIPLPAPPSPPGPTTTITNLAGALPGGSGPIPFADRVLRDVLLGPAGRASLSQGVALPTRSLRGFEVAEVLSGRELYNDLGAPRVADPDANASGHDIALHRIRRQTALRLIAEHDELFGSRGDGRVNPGLASLREAWGAFRNQPDGPSDTKSFRAFLARGVQYGDAMAYFERVNGFFRDLGVVGITPAERAAVIARVREKMLPASGVAVKADAGAVAAR